MVGDNRHDLEMARAGGAGLAVGVLSGTGTREALPPLADVVLDSVADLPAYLATRAMRCTGTRRPVHCRASTSRRSSGRICRSSWCRWSLGSAHPASPRPVSGVFSDRAEAAAFAILGVSLGRRRSTRPPLPCHRNVRPVN